MKNNIKIKARRFESRIYVGLLIFLSALSLPFLNSCRNESQQTDQIVDSLGIRIRELETQLQARADSLHAARKELQRQDSLKALREKPNRSKTGKSDSVQTPAPQKPTYVPQQPAVDYGITPYYDRPTLNIPNE